MGWGWLDGYGSGGNDRQILVWAPVQPGGLPEDEEGGGGGLGGGGGDADAVADEDAWSD